MRPTLLFILVALLAPTANHAASFDCSKAHSLREKTVCATPELSTLDDNVAKAYASTRAELSPASSALIQQDQRDWLHWLDAVCPTPKPQGFSVATCLTNHYTDRLQQLSKDTQHVNGLLFYARAHFVYIPGNPTPAEPTPSTDPGFGYGNFTWPQIDNPTPEQQAWNQAIYAATIKVSCCPGEEKSISTLDAAADKYGSVDVFYNLYAANSRFISVDLGNSTYGWGAAHPNTGIMRFNWWLTSGRELKATDIYQPNSGWQQKLVAPGVAKLKSITDDGDGNSIWKPEDIAKAVATEIATPSAWSVSQQGLVINFGQYEVAPYSSGMPTITFTWKELQPYLAPDFQPAALPPAIPAQN
jgi:uncharacterized protein YecT (DUF1311 family)